MGDGRFDGCPGVGVCGLGPPRAKGVVVVDGADVVDGEVMVLAVLPPWPEG